MHDLIGQTLGQYRVVEQLGKGGMATVFKAFQPSLERYVAIKVLPPYFVHEEGFSERFVREAKAIARLDHPHILPIYDYGQEEGVSYIVMKYVDAGTLKDLQAGNPMPLARAVTIVQQVADALDYAHGQGIIHRDIKPANVLMDRHRWALLTDFGLARMVEGSQQLTASGVGVGTPAYMAPEQGQGHQVDVRVDLYSLGIVLYEMLTGRVPYEAETPLAVVLKHITDPLPMPRLVNPQIPEAIELVILKALAKSPDDRYQSAAEMAKAAGRAVEDAKMVAETDLLPSPEPPAPDVATVPVEVAEGRLPLPKVAEPPQEGEEPIGAAEPSLPTMVETPPIELMEDAPPIVTAEVSAEATAPSAEATAPSPAVDAIEAPSVAEEAMPSDAAVQAPVSASEPSVQVEQKAKPKARIPWWAIAVGAVLIVALIAGGVLLATGGLSKEPTPTATSPAFVSQQPTATSPPAKPTQAGSGESPGGKEEPLRIGLRLKPSDEAGAAMEELEAVWSERMGMPVEIIAAEDDSGVAHMLLDRQVDAALLSMAEYLWLRDDEGVHLKPILQVGPVFSAQLLVHAESDIHRLQDLRGRPVALISWNAFGGILGRAAAIDEGLNVDEECKAIYLSPQFNREAIPKALQLVLDRRVDAAVLHNFALAMVEEERPGAGEELRLLLESQPASVGVVVAWPDLEPDLVDELRIVLLETDRDHLGAVTPQNELFDFDEALIEHFTEALKKVGLQAWQLVERESPEPWVEPDLLPPEEPKPPEEGSLCVGIVPAAGASIEKGRFSPAVVKSLERVVRDLDLELRPKEVPEGAQPVEVALELVHQGCNVIVAIGWGDPESLWTLAREQPDATFIGLGQTYAESLPNLVTFAYRMEEAGFVAGALAGKATESRRVAVVAGMHVAAIERLVGGFESGLRTACPDCELIVEWADSFTDLRRGEKLGRQVAEEGADVVFNAGGPLGSAAIRSAAQEGAWVIGIDWDEYITTFLAGRAPNADHLLGSVVFRLDKQAREAISRFVHGDFEPGSFVLGFGEGGIEFVPSPQAAHPEREQLEGFLKEVIGGVASGELQP